MLADWLSDEGRKAIEKMGWPTWMRKTPGRPGGDEQQCWLTLDKRGWFTGGWGKEWPIMEHAALALLRDRARGWLARQGACVVLDGLYRADVWEWVWRVKRMNPLPICHRFFEDYDAALVAAVLATETT